MNIIVYFFAYMMEDFTIWFYCNLISDPKQKKYYNLIYISFVYLSLWLFCFFQNVYLNLFLFAITTYFIIHWLYSISKLPALFHSLVIFLSMTLSELFVASICSHFIIQYWHHWTDTNLFIFQTIISKMIYLLIMYVLARLQKNSLVHHLHQPDHSLFFLSAITFCYMFVSILLYIFGLQFPESSLSNCIIFITTVLLLVILFLVYALYNYNNKRNSDLLQLKLRLQKEQNLAEYNTALISQDTARRTLIHDIRNHLLSISILNQQKRYAELDQYIQTLIHSEQLAPSIRICDNNLLNATLLRYQTFCHTKGIRFEVTIENHSIDFLSDTDLTALFCNLLDNAVTAADKVPSGWISLHVELFSPLHGILITMKNSCMDRPPQNSRHEWLTTKKESSTHGFGMKSIRRIADTYHGELQTAYLDHEHIFQTIITMYPQKEQVTHAHFDL